MRGQFYSMIAIVIAIPIMFFISGTLLSVQESKYDVIEKITADQLASIERNIEDDFNFGAEAVFKRAILAATDAVITNGTYLNDSYVAVLELGENGTLFGEPKYLMINNTLGSWRSKILNKTSTFTIDLDYVVSGGQQIGVAFEGTYALSVTVRDRFNRGVMERLNIPKDFSFSVEGFEDPVFPLTTYGLVRRQYALYKFPITGRRFNGTIANTNITGNITFNDTLSPAEKAQLILITNKTSVSSGWRCVVGPPGFDEQSHSCYVKLIYANPIREVNNTMAPLNLTEVYVDNKTSSLWFIPIKEALRRGLYIEGVIPGPDILNRLSGITKGFNTSFITFINTDDYIKVGLPVINNISRVDWLYWNGNTSTGRPYRGFEEFGWFYLDSATDDYFNISELRN